MKDKRKDDRDIYREQMKYGCRSAGLLGVGSADRDSQTSDRLPSNVCTHARISERLHYEFGRHVNLMQIDLMGTFGITVFVLLIFMKIMENHGFFGKTDQNSMIFMKIDKNQAV